MSSCRQLVTCLSLDSWEAINQVELEMFKKRLLDNNILLKVCEDNMVPDEVDTGLVLGRFGLSSIGCFWQAGWMKSRLRADYPPVGEWLMSH